MGLPVIAVSTLGVIVFVAGLFFAVRERDQDRADREAAESLRRRIRPGSRAA